MKTTDTEHPLLAGLQALWGHDDDTLNKILWVNTYEHSRDESIGFANEYIEFMDSTAETDDPAEAWEDWCHMHCIEHEIDNNPYL